MSPISLKNFRFMRHTTSSRIQRRNDNSVVQRNGHHSTTFTTTVEGWEIFEPWNKPCFFTLSIYLRPLKLDSYEINPLLACFPKQLLKFLTEQFKIKMFCVSWECTVTVKSLKIARKMV